MKLFEQNRPVDAVVLDEGLGKRKLLEEIGGKSYIAAILSSVPSAANGTHYASIVREKALLRQLIGASHDILRDAYAPARAGRIRAGSCRETHLRHRPEKDR